MYVLFHFENYLYVTCRHHLLEELYHVYVKFDKVAVYIFYFIIKQDTSYIHFLNKNQKYFSPIKSLQIIPEEP